MSWWQYNSSNANRSVPNVQRKTVMREDRDGASRVKCEQRRNRHPEGRRCGGGGAGSTTVEDRVHGLQARGGEKEVCQCIFSSGQSNPSAGGSTPGSRNGIIRPSNGSAPPLAGSFLACNATQCRTPMSQYVSTRPCIHMRYTSRFLNRYLRRGG